MDKPKNDDTITKLVDKGFRAAPPKRWPDYKGGELDRTLYVTASESGACMRNAWYKKFQPEDADTSKETYGFAERGHTSEAWTVEQLRRSGAKLMLVGDDQRSFFYGHQSGTPDGILVVTGGWYLLEFKGIDPRTNIYNLPKKVHLDQVQQNMFLVEKCLGGNMLGAYIDYADASNYERRFGYKVAVDRVRQEELTRRAERVMTAKKALDIPPEGVYSDGCGYCQYKHICDGATTARENEKVNTERLKNVASKLFG